MARISWGGRLRSRFAGADGDSVVDTLEERCGILVLLVWFRVSAGEELTLGRNAHPRNERMDDMAVLCMLRSP